MILNIAKFKDNGECGYILKPDSLLGKNSISLSKQSYISIHLIEARVNHTNSPDLSIELLGTSTRLVESVRKENNLYHIRLDEVVTICIDDNIFLVNLDFRSSETKRYYCGYPIKCLRAGYRLFPLYQEGIEQPGCYILSFIKLIE